MEVLHHQVRVEGGDVGDQPDLLDEAKERLPIIVEDGGRRHPLEPLDLFGREHLAQAEVEEGDPPVAVEHVVAGVRITVEDPKVVNPAEDEPVDRLRGEISLLL